MRIIGGELGGRTLVAPRGLKTRPTSEKVRQAIFNVVGPPPVACQVLDLFAGSGAMGFEALSRGAERLALVERARPALEAIRSNASKLDLLSRVDVFAEDVSRALVRLGGAGRRFFWIFIDPPYAAGALDHVLEQISNADLLAPGGVVVAEHDKRHLPAGSCGILDLSDRRRYGETEVSYYRSGQAT